MDAVVASSDPASLPAVNRDNCFHCGLPIAADSDYRLIIETVEQRFCCPACQMVAATIIDGGLGQFYQQRDQFANKPDDEAEFAAIDQRAWQQQFVYRNRDGDLSIELLIGDMHCAACSWLLENRLARLPGVIHVGVSLSDKKALVSWRDESFSLSNLLDTIRRIGYHAEPFSPSAARRQQDTEKRLALRRLGIAGLVMMQVGMLAGAMYTGAFDDIVHSGITDSVEKTADTHWGHWLRWTSLIISLPILYSAMPIFSGAWRGIKNWQFGMDVSVSIALLLAFVASCHATITGSGEIYFDAVTMFVFLLLASRFLEMQARHYQARGNADIRSLLPATALRLDNGTLQRVPVAALQIGDSVQVKPGQIVPADGVLLSDSATLDESMLSGEATPQHKTAGNNITAGTHNTDQPFTFRLTALAGQLRLDHIARITDQAAQNKPAFAQLADRIANYFVITVLVIAALVLAIGWHSDNPYAVANTIAVLVVSCPCALSLAMPTAIAIATHYLRHNGILITASHVWEGMASISDVVFDKTGTLTSGQPRYAAIKTLAAINDQQVLEIIAALEASINHPLAEAFRDITTPLNASRVENITGSGVRGIIDGETYAFGKTAFVHTLLEENYSATELNAPDDINNWLLLASAQQPLAWIQIEESLKPDAAELLAGLKKLTANNAQPLTLHLLSGDQHSSVTAIATQLGIQHWRANASPEQKLDYISQLQADGKRVLMVGDGINDIPVLAQADISVAVNSASELAKLRADAILLTGTLMPLLRLWQATVRTRRIIRENLWWAVLYNVLAIPLAAVGLVAPWLAAIGMSASSLIVVGNAWRLRK